MNIKTLLKKLKKHYPKAKCSLEYRNPFELLIATILSAQCTDKRVNIVTSHLFKKFPNAKALAEADIEEIKAIIKSTGFYNSKARSIKEASRIISEKFGGHVPDNMQYLLLLPAVARKTANVVLSSAFGKNEGIAVDTHVKRLSFRLGLTKHSNPLKIEKDLMKILSQKDWGFFSNALILHGRNLCFARNPKCNKCFLKNICPQKGLKKQGSSS